MVEIGVQSNARSSSEVGKPAVKVQLNMFDSSVWMPVNALMMSSGQPIRFVVYSITICSYQRNSSRGLYVSALDRSMTLDVRMLSRV